MPSRPWHRPHPPPTLEVARVRAAFVRTLQDLKELLELGKAGKIPPIPIETRSAERATESLADLKTGGKVSGRIVMTH